MATEIKLVGGRDVRVRASRPCADVDPNIIRTFPLLLISPTAIHVALDPHPPNVISVAIATEAPMEEGKSRTEYQGIAAEFAAAKARQEQEEAQGLRNRSGDAKAVEKRRELQFKSSHSLLVAFFVLMV